MLVLKRDSHNRELHITASNGELIIVALLSDAPAKIGIEANPGVSIKRGEIVDREEAA